MFWDNSFTGVVTGSTQRVQAYFTIVWRPTADPADLERTIDYDGDESNGDSGTMLWCAGRTARGFRSSRPLRATVPSTSTRAPELTFGHPGASSRMIGISIRTA